MSYTEMADQSSSQSESIINLKSNESNDKLEKSLTQKQTKTDSEDESDALIIRPKIAQPKKKYQFSITKQSTNPLKQLKLKKIAKEKPASSSKSSSEAVSLSSNPIQSDERKVYFTYNLPNPDPSDKKRERSERGSPESRRHSRSSRRSRSYDRKYNSRSPSDHILESYKNMTTSEKDKSKTPSRDLTKGFFYNKANKSGTGLGIDEHYDIKLRSDNPEERAQTEVNNSLKKMETIIDILNASNKPRFNLLALPREGSSNKELISYSQKIVHFTSTVPTITWAPNPKLENKPYYMSRDFYLAHANADQILLYRAIAESNHIKFEDSQSVIDARSWYPKDYLMNPSEKPFVSNQLAKRKSKEREKRISLVDYDSADEREELKSNKSPDPSSLKMKGNTVKVMSKWDSDYDESSSEFGKRLPPAKSKRIEKSYSPSSQAVKKKDEPEQLVNEYEEFLKQVGSETPDNKQYLSSPSAKDKLKIGRTNQISQPSGSQNNWDEDSSSRSDKKSPKVTSKSKKSESVKQKQEKKKKDIKKKIVSNSDSSSESSDSSSESSNQETKKKKRKHKKKKKRTKKVKVETSSSDSDEVEKKSQKKKAKKSKKSKAAKVSQELQVQKLAIAEKLSELDSVSDKKSKKAIVKKLKSLEEQILKISNLEILLLPKKKIKSKKEKKNKKKASSSSDSDSDIDTKKKETKKAKNKKKNKKKVSSDSSSDSDVKIKKKKKKNASQKDKKVKKNIVEIKSILENVKENSVESNENSRKRPAEVDISNVARSKRKIQYDDISGWEDDDTKIKEADETKFKECDKIIKINDSDSDLQSQQNRPITDNKIKIPSFNNSSDINVGESNDDKQGIGNCDWEANSESGLMSIDNERRRLQGKPNISPKLNIENKSEIRAFGAITQKTSPVLSKQTGLVFDLYSPGDNDSDGADNTPAPADPIIREDSISMPFSIPPVSETSNFVLPISEHHELTLSSSAGCAISLDDVYDPLALDSDASEESIPKIKSSLLPVGLDDIPLPAFSSVADILLPGEAPSKNSLKKIEEKNVVSKKQSENVPEIESPVKTNANRWDIVDKSLDNNSPIDVSSLDTIPLLIPKLPPISFSKLSVPMDVDKPSQPSSTPFITVKKGNTKLQSKVASVFQSDSDGDDSVSLLRKEELKVSVTNLPITSIGEIDITNLPTPKIPAREIEKPSLHEKKLLDVVEKINSKFDEMEKEKNYSDQETVDRKEYNEREMLENKEFERGKADCKGHNEKDEIEQSREKTAASRRKFSVSPKRRESRRSPDRHERRRSRSPERRRSRTPERKKTRTPERKRSRTPDRRRSRSPHRRVKRRSRSLEKRDNWRRRSPSPRRKQQALSPKQRRRPPSPRRHRSRTKSRSYSPRAYRRSRSPVRRQNSPSRLSPTRRPPHHSPTRRRSFSPSTRSPGRRLSSSPLLQRSRDNLNPVYGQMNPPLPTMPFPAPIEKVMTSSMYTMSVDHRIMHEFGVKLDSPPQLPLPTPTEPPHFYYPSPPAFQVVPIPPFSASQGGVVQVGNIMEVVPSVHALPPPPPPPPPPNQQIVQVGNMLQVVPTTRATAVVAPTPITPDPVTAIDANVLQNPLIKAIQAEREKMKKEKDGRRAEREARRRARQAKREAKLMSVSEKLKNVERNEGLVLGQDVDDEELLLEAMEPPSPPRPVKVVIAGHLPPAGKSILVTPVFNEIKDNSAKKHVSFADGLKPGDLSEGEAIKNLKPKTLPKEKRFKKKVKKKVKVRIIRQVVQSDEEDELPPPSPPPGDPPPILYATFPFGGQVQYPVYQTSVTTTTTKTTLHMSAPLPQ